MLSPPQPSSAAARALERAQDLCDAGEDGAALEQVKRALELQPEYAMASVMKSWLEKFGRGTEADTAVRRVLACAPGDFYAVLGSTRFVVPPRAEYLRLSLLLHPDKCGARNAGAAFQRVTEAYNALRDPEQRAKYDDKLRRSDAAAANASARAGGPAAPPRPGGSQSGSYQRRPTTAPPPGWGGKGHGGPFRSGGHAQSSAFSIGKYVTTQYRTTNVSAINMHPVRRRPLAEQKKLDF